MSDLQVKLVISQDGSGKVSGQIKGLSDDVKGFGNDSDRAGKLSERAFDRTEKSARRAGGALRNMAAGLAGFVTGVVSFASFNRLLQVVTGNTIKQEQSQAQLAAAIASTGAAARLSVSDLEAQAAALQRVTTFGDESIEEIQAKLLTFTGISGEIFEETTERVLDLATRMQGDLNGAVVQLGKALNDPLQNLTALSRAGIQFTDQQRDQVRALVESGRLLEAQKIILVELETQFGGSARAARNTFGGALAGLRNNVGDLLEVNTGLPAATAAIETISQQIADPALQQQADEIFSGLIASVPDMVGALVDGAQFIIENFDNIKTVGESLAIFLAARLGVIGLVGLITSIGSVASGLFAARGGAVALNAALRVTPIGAIASVVGIVASLTFGLRAAADEGGNLNQRLLDASKSATELQRQRISLDISEARAELEGLSTQLGSLQIKSVFSNSAQLDQEILGVTVRIDETRRAIASGEKALQKLDKAAADAAGSFAGLGASARTTTPEIELNEKAVSAAILALQGYGTEQEKLALIEADRNDAIELLTDNQASLEASGVTLAAAIVAINRRADEQVAALISAANEVDDFTSKINAMLDPIRSADEQLLLLNLALEEALSDGNVQRADQITRSIERLAGAGEDAQGAFDGLAESLSRDIGNALANGQGIGNAIGTSLTNFGVSGLTKNIEAVLDGFFDELEGGDRLESAGRAVALGVGVGLTEGAGAGAAAAAGAFLGDEIGNALGDALTDVLGDIGGPLGELIGGIAGQLIIGSIVKAFTKAPRISVSGDSDVDRFGTNDVEALQTDLGDVFVGLRKIPPEIADQIKRAIQEIDKSIAIAIEGASNLDTINAALAAFDQQAKAKQFSTAELIEARFDAVLSAFDGFTEGIVNQASLLEDRIQRLNDVIDIGARFALGDTLGLTGAGFVGTSPAPIAPSPVGPPGGGPGLDLPSFRLQSDDLAKFNAVIQGTGDAADVSSPALQQTIAIVDEVARTGETLADSFGRLLQSTAAVNELAGLLNTQFSESQEGVIRFGDALTKAFGDDLARLQAGLDTIFSRFFTQDERLINDAEQSRQRAVDLFGSLGIEVTEALLTESGFREAFQELADLLPPEQLAILIEAGVAVDSLLTAEESLAEIRNTAAQEAIAAAEDAADAERDRVQSLRDGINGLLGIEETQIDQINDRANALLALANSESELLEVEFARAQALAALQAELEASVASIAEQLLGGSSGSLVGRSISGIQRVNQAVDDRYRREVEALENISDLVDDLLLSSISPLTPQERLDEARSQLDAAFAAAEGGDVAALESLPGLVQQFLGELSSFTGGVGIFPQEFQDTLDRLADLQAAGPQAPEPVTGQQVGGIAASASSIEQTALQQVQLAQQLIQELSLLADLDQDVLQVLEDSGLSLSQLVDIIGVDLRQLTADQVGILGTLAEDFGLSLEQLQTELDISLGSLADATSLLNDGLEQAINGLPPEIAGPLLAALADLEQTGDVSGLESLISDLSPALRNELAPFFDAIDVTTQADAQVDELSKINTGIQDMTVHLERIANNLSEQNTNLDIPSFATGTGFAPGGLANIHAGEIIFPAPVSDFARRSGLQIGGAGGDSRAVVQRLERLEAVLTEGNADRKRQTATIATGNANMTNAFTDAKFDDRRNSFIRQPSRGGQNCGG